MKSKISYLISHPIQYFSPLFRAIASEDTIDLAVYYCSNPAKTGRMDEGFGAIVSWDMPLLDGYNYEFLPNVSPNEAVNNKFWSLINLGVVKKLYFDKSEILIIHGWGYFTNWLAFFTALLLGKQVWLRSENPYNQEIIKPFWLRIVKKVFLKFGLFKLADRVLYIGTQNKNFYAYYGVPDRKLIYAPYCVYNDFFLTQAATLQEKKHDIKTTLGLAKDSIVILFSGKYIFKKRPMDLLKAYALLKNKNVALIMVGDGELRQEMERFRDENRLTDVLLTGFINQSEIGKYYSVADIFVLPSGPGETWGLVVNEAMLFGLPVIASDTVGSSIDLVKHGENGFVFKEGDVKGLATYLSTLVNNESLRVTAGHSSRQIIERYNYAVMIDNIKKNLKTEK